MSTNIFTHACAHIFICTREHIRSLLPIEMAQDRGELRQAAITKARLRQENQREIRRRQGAHRIDRHRKHRSQDGRYIQ